MGDRSPAPSPVNSPRVTSEPDAHNEGRERLERIRRWWEELKAAPKYSPKYEALMQRIRGEADAFRQTLGSDDPGPKR
jgi:hypothetical protein